MIARAGISGGTWLDIWLPQLVGGGGSAATRGSDRSRRRAARGHRGDPPA